MRLGFVEGGESKSVVRGGGVSLAPRALDALQDANVWSKMPKLAPVHFFD